MRRRPTAIGILAAAALSAGLLWSVGIWSSPTAGGSSGSSASDVALKAASSPTTAVSAPPTIPDLRPTLPSAPPSGPAPSATAGGHSPDPSLEPLPSSTSVQSSGGPPILHFRLPAPWTGGRENRFSVFVYLPPGYHAGGTVRYPVVYEVPYGVAGWANWMQLTPNLDRLIRAGTIPPEIVAFVGISGGPFRDAECANSLDGRQWIDTFIAGPLVTWMDAHFATIRSREARATLGASEGGYCAAALWSHHPDVFGAALIESGYFTSGIRSAETRDAWRPFGGNVAYMRRTSPINVVPGIDPALRRNSLILIEGNPKASFYGPQMRAFVDVLRTADVPLTEYPDPAGHALGAFRRVTPLMFIRLGRWMVDQGVFRGGGA